MTDILILALTHIGAFVAGAFLHRWLAKRVVEAIQPTVTANSTTK